MPNVEEYGMKPQYCIDCGGEWFQYFADDEYEYFKCLNCDKRIKVLIK